MKNPRTMTAATVAAISLIAGGCGGDDSTATSATTSTATQAGPPGGGAPGGGIQQAITAVDSNTDGASAGGANTAEVVKAANAFRQALDSHQRDTASYDFTDNKARQSGRISPCRSSRVGASL